MPHNEKGEVTCVNHPQQVMLAGALAVNQLDASVLTDIKRVEGDLAVTAYLCPQCEYMELYRGIQPQKIKD